MGRKDVLVMCHETSSPDRERTKLLASCSRPRPGERLVKNQLERLKGQASFITFLLYIFRSAPQKALSLHEARASTVSPETNG